MKDLINADSHIPDTWKEKDLRACEGCKLVQSYRQWSKSSSCPNCRISECQSEFFSGLVSVMLPSQSWTAKWNKLETRHPGIYAITVLSDVEENETERHNQ